MCQKCGCAEVNEIAISTTTNTVEPSYDRIRSHEDARHHHHDHSKEIQDIVVRESLLSKNDRLAERNRGYFQAKDLLAINILSSPGAGKTTLIERTIKDLSARGLRIGVIVGDLATDNDARRLRAVGAPAVQITTGNACHLEADMVSRAMQQFDLDSLDILTIENVGNLVCPAAYDLGEKVRIVLLSVTEGEDKPLKYPTMFKTADVVLIAKSDLAAAVEFDRQLAISNIQQIAPQAKILEISARTGEGMKAWENLLFYWRFPQARE
jgi:hydrogenase nickel incorporation protein HypB